MPCIVISAIINSMSNDNVNDKLDDTVNQMLDAALTGNNYKVDSILNNTINSLADDVNYLHRDYTLPDFLRDYTSSADNASNAVNTNSNSSTPVSDDTYIQVSVVDDTNNADDSNTEIIDAEIVDD